MNKEEESQEYADEAVMFANRKDYSKLKVKLKRAISLNPKNKYAYFSSGNILYKMHQFKEAGDQFAIASRIAPNFLEAYIHWGNSTFLQGDHNKAIQLYKKVIELSPDDDLALNNWGFGLYSLMQFPEAIIKYIEAIYKDSRQNLAYFNLSLLLFHQENPIEATKVFQKGMVATSNGFYSLSDLLEIYSLQVTHTEEKISIETDPEQIDYLQRKLSAIKQVVELLSKGTEQKYQNNYEEKQERGESQFGISDIMADPKKMLYCISLFKQLNFMLTEIFFVNKSGFVDQKNDLVTEFVGVSKESLALLNIKEKRHFILSSENVSNKQFNQNFRNIEQLKQFIQIVTLQATILREPDLLKHDRSPLSNEARLMFENIRKIFKIHGVLFKVEEFAFIDSLTILFICLTQLNQALQPQSSDEMIERFTIQTVQTLKSFIQWSKEEDLI